MADRGRVAPGRSPDRTTRSPGCAGRRIAVPSRGGAAGVTGATAGRGPLRRLLLGAAPLLTVLALAEAPGAGPGWAETPGPAAVAATGKAAATAVAGAMDE